MEPKAFADDWVDSWNSHDLDRILAHYDSEIVFLSPIALQTVGNGRVAGIEFGSNGKVVRSFACYAC